MSRTLDRAGLSIPRFCVLFLLLFSRGVEGTQDQPREPVRRAVSLQSVSVLPDASGVLIQADGPLPEPVDGQLQAPPRVYLDLPGVTPGTARSVKPGSSPIAGVRVALNSGNPVVTRVVVDLALTCRYRLDLSARAAGRVTIAFDASPAPSGTSPAPPARRPVPLGARSSSNRTSTPPAPAPPPKPGAVPPAVAAAREQYLLQIMPSLARLQDLLPLLTSIEKLAPAVTTDSLQTAERMFETIGRELAAVKPASPVVVQHDMLQRVCVLGARAAHLRADSLASGEPSTTANASSAAAGAMMLLARARQELGQ